MQVVRVVVKVRLRSVQSIRTILSSTIRQKLHVVVEDATQVGKPLMLTTNSPAQWDALVLFLGQPVAQTTQQPQHLHDSNGSALSEFDLIYCRVFPAGVQGFKLDPWHNRLDP
jgi:hypothetical protein